MWVDLHLHQLGDELAPGSPAEQHLPRLRDVLEFCVHYRLAAIEADLALLDPLAEIASRLWDRPEVIDDDESWVGSDSAMAESNTDRACPSGSTRRTIDCESVVDDLPVVCQLEGFAVVDWPSVNSEEVRETIPRSLTVHGPALADQAVSSHHCEGDIKHLASGEVEEDVGVVGERGLKILLEGLVLMR